MNLYSVLGVEPDADAETIRRAYRSQAKRHHPDAGGNPARFQQITLAHKVLAHPDRRKRYDATGAVDETSEIDATRTFALRILGTLIQQFLQHAEHHVMVDNAPARMAEGLAKRKAELEKTITDLEKRHKRFLELSERFTSKQENLLRSMIETRARETLAPLSAIKEEIAAIELATTLLKNHEFTPEEAAHMTVTLWNSDGATSTTW